MGGKVDAAYYRAYRSANPEYREKERRRRAERRRIHGRGDRSREYARQRERRAEQRRIRDASNGTVVSDHPVMTRAIEVADRLVRRDRRRAVTDGRHEEAVCTAALALLEGEDADAAVRRQLAEARRWAWWNHTGDPDRGLDSLWALQAGARGR